MEGKKAIGVYGGTFDPVHIAHLILAEEARAKLKLDRVLFTPDKCPWMKWYRSITAPQHRLAMLKLAVESNPSFHISTVDLVKPGPSFTVETLRTLKQQMGETCSLYFLMGMDSLRDLHQWKEPQNIKLYAKTVALARPGCEEPDWEHLNELIPQARDNIILVKGPLIDISSTEIRHRVAQGLSIRYWVPEAVERYIYEHGLYKEGQGEGDDKKL